MLQRAASNAYSWWWASHIRTKQSKWMEQNLQDMEEKVANVIKLIEEDGDSFAKRAEMYYKKRPELINFVEESYKAYRALAERYDHISTELQNANNTIASVFPDRVPFIDDDDDDGSPRPPRKIPEGFKQNIPKPPLKDLRSVVTTATATKKFQSKKPAAASANSKAPPKSGLSRKEAIEEVDKLQKQILALQTVKEFVKSSYDNAIARYWETEEQIQELQEKVSILQDELGEGIVIEDSVARRLMAEAALKSCQEALTQLEEKQEKSLDETRIESKRIKEVKAKLGSLMDEFHYDQSNSKEPRAKRDIKIAAEKKDLEEEEERLTQRREELQLLQNNIKEQFQASSNSSLSVAEMAEKIDELVNKVISLETAVSSQTALVTRLRTETDELQDQIRTLEGDKVGLINDKNRLNDQLREMEEKLHQVQDLNQIVEDQNSNIQTNFTGAWFNLDHISEKVKNETQSEEVKVTDLSQTERNASDQAESKYEPEGQVPLKQDNVSSNDIKSDKELKAAGVVEDAVNSDKDLKAGTLEDDLASYKKSKDIGSPENGVNTDKELKAAGLVEDAVNSDKELKVGTLEDDLASDTKRKDIGSPENGVNTDKEIKAAGSLENNLKAGDEVKVAALVEDAVNSNKELKVGTVEHNLTSDKKLEVTSSSENGVHADNELEATGSLKNDVKLGNEVKVTGSLQMEEATPPVENKYPEEFKEQERILNPANGDEKATVVQNTTTGNQEVGQHQLSDKADSSSESLGKQQEIDAKEISSETENTLRVDPLEKATAQDDEPDWQQMFLSGIHDREQILLTEYTNTLRNYRDVKKRLTEVEKKLQDNNLDQLNELKAANALKDEEIRLLRDKLRLLNRSLEGTEVTDSTSVLPHNIEELLKIENPETTSAIEEKFRANIDEILEENLAFWIKFSASLAEIQRFETTIKDLMTEVSKIEDRDKALEGSNSTKYALKSDARPIYKHLSEIQSEITVWLEKSGLLKEELQHRFSSLCHIQEEITSALKDSAEDDEFTFTSYQAAKFQGEVLNMKQENNKVADELQAGLDIVTSLQLEIEKALAKLNDQFGFSASKRQESGELRHSETRARVPLRSFIFGVKPKKQSIFSRMSPGMHRKLRASKGQGNM